MKMNEVKYVYDEYDNEILKKYMVQNHLNHSIWSAKTVHTCRAQDIRIKVSTEETGSHSNTRTWTSTSSSSGIQAAM